MREDHKGDHNDNGNEMPQNEVETFFFEMQGADAWYRTNPKPWLAQGKANIVDDDPDESIQAG